MISYSRIILNISIALILLLSFPSCKRLNQELLNGKWQAVKWEIEGEMRSPQGNPEEISFKFRTDDSYTYIMGEDVSEDGTYDIWFNMLYLYSNGEEKAMRITCLVQDSLVLSFDDFDRIKLVLTRKGQE